MKVKTLKNKLPEKFYNTLEFEELRPSQSKAIKAGLLVGENIVVCSPTASGKTFVAELAGIKRIIEEGGKMIYIVPLKSLASEKVDEFKEKYEDLGIKTALSIGDPDSSEGWLAKYDIIVCTSEKFDSLLRHKIPWLREVKTVVVDEIHLLNDFRRGPVLEVILTLIKKLIPKAQIIGLSATIGNPEDLSRWLDAKLVMDDWRPIELFQGNFYEDKIDFFGSKDNIEIGKKVSDDTLRIALDTMNKNKQALIFCPTKRSAESTAVKISKLVEEVESNERISNSVLRSASSPTAQCKKLSEVISKGIAFHHAGLVQKQKKSVEDGFRNDKIKIICCTPTLAMGVNLPAFRVIMKSLKRYSGRSGMDWIPVLEYHQMTGRAGRPDFDNAFGEAISIAASEKDRDLIREKYIEGEPEEIVSKLSVEPVLRTAILSLVASEFVTKFDELIEFFKGTFYGYQYDDDFGFEFKVEDALKDVEKFGFLNIQERELKATPIGKRVSELYIDPSAAFDLIQGLRKMPSDFEDMILLHLISSNAEMYPWTNVQKKDFDWLEEHVEELSKNIVTKIPKEWDYEYNEFLRKTKTAVIIENWIRELKEDFLLSNYNVTPGELRNKISVAEWLLYGASELCVFLGEMEKISGINKLKFRIKNGIKEELIPLVKIRGVGRVRARKLFNAGIKNVIGLRNVSTEKIATLIGSEKIAQSIKKQVGHKRMTEVDFENF
jgi:helicase